MVSSTISLRDFVRVSLVFGEEVATEGFGDGTATGVGAGEGRTRGLVAGVGVEKARLPNMLSEGGSFEGRGSSLAEGRGTRFVGLFTGS
jgi:hypothetical protein